MSNSGKNWDELGVTFKLATEKDRPELTQFLLDNFFPDEPLFRASQIVSDRSSCVSPMFTRHIRDATIIDPALKTEGTTLLAIKDGKIIASR